MAVDQDMPLDDFSLSAALLSAPSQVSLGSASSSEKQISSYDVASSGQDNLNKHRRLNSSDASVSTTSPSSTTPQVRPSGVGHPMTHFPVSLFKAFNGGDLVKVEELIRQHTTSTVALRTPALDDDVYGPTNIIHLFNYIYDSHPDAVWVAKKCKCFDLTEQGPEGGGGAGVVGLISCKIYFAGTRTTSSTTSILPGVNDYSYLFKRPQSSLLDEMDISALTEQEIDAMRILEQKSRNLAVFGKGALLLFLNQDDKIARMEFDWVISSFREADV